FQAEIATFRRGVEIGNSLALYPQHCSILSACRHSNFDLLVVKTGHLYLCAQTRLDEIDRNYTVEVDAISLEELVGLNLNKYVQVASFAALRRRLALPGNIYPLPVFDSRGNRDLNSLILLRHAGAMTGPTRVLDNRAF